ncbi:hypothetical protein DFJ58DRAFT_291260 [Suillus subalutaceus]|uniref:uncharacterized protein n=1 Tax=Suillus subalutaceus TaxID=48586 RepID=UPI001B87C43A|nr:uncharacterized protein DFJ58DRAFT_291260 [Suillus subalutaceus]KAG1858972.1 hypothetical protein DFJ58DRAFT_291260 [Suillus subalutaceus]
MHCYRQTASFSVLRQSSSHQYFFLFGCLSPCAHSLCVAQKKSKKDPGIPNNFPYKDQILAEVAESRRQATEEKQRRKNEKRPALTGLDAEDAEDSQKNITDVDVDENQNDGQGFDGIMSIRPAPLVPSKKKSVEPSNSGPVIPVTEGLQSLREVLQKADVLLHVVDAWDPAAGLSEALFREATGKDIILLVNKLRQHERSLYVIYRGDTSCIQSKLNTCAEIPRLHFSGGGFCGQANGCKRTPRWAWESIALAFFFLN